jgi:hypothetical protein
MGVVGVAGAVMGVAQYCRVLCVRERRHDEREGANDWWTPHWKFKMNSKLEIQSNLI